MKEIVPDASDAENPDPMKANEKGKGKAIPEEKMAVINLLCFKEVFFKMNYT